MMHGKYVKQSCSNFDLFKKTTKGSHAKYICLRFISGILCNETGNEGRNTDDFGQKIIYYKLLY